MSLLALFKGVGPSGFGYGTTAEGVTEGLDLRGRTMLVTGCNSGLGLATVRTLVKRGVKVIATARTEEKARDVCGPLGGETIPLACELSKPSSVRGCVDAVKGLGLKLDAIICNAGIMAPPKLEQVFGYELQFFTNHVGHFILATGLLDQLSDRGRVVVVTSALHKRTPEGGIAFDNLSGAKGYVPWTAYGQSKLANLLFAKELGKRLAGTTKTANAVHPGVIRTNLGRRMSLGANMALAAVQPLFLKNVEQGAATQCYVATHPGLAEVSGEYFSDCNVAKSTSTSRDPALATRLWQETERIVAELH